MLRPVNHGSGIPFLSPPDNLENLFDDLDTVSKCKIGDEINEVYDLNSNEPKHFSVWVKWCSQSLRSF